MIKLKKIERNNQYIQCQAFVEDCEIPVNLKFDIDNNQLLPCVLPDEYSYCTGHINHAQHYLEQIAHSAEIPNEKLIMWY